MLASHILRIVRKKHSTRKCHSRAHVAAHGPVVYSIRQQWSALMQASEMEEVHSHVGARIGLRECARWLLRPSMPAMTQSDVINENKRTNMLEVLLVLVNVIQRGGHTQVRPSMRVVDTFALLKC